MTGITASQVRDLRESTGAGMMDCKKALTEADGDMENAVDWLRKAGLAAAAKKAGRVAAEGLVAVVTSSGSGAAVEVNSETDFVSRNETFQELATAVAGIALAKDGDVAAVGAAEMDDGVVVGDRINELVSTIGENISLRRAASLRVPNGTVVSYVHNAAAPGLGRIGVLVALESTGDEAALQAFGHQLAMHVAAAAPQWTNVAEVDTTILDRERSFLAEQARGSGKPEDIIAKMVEGRLRKFYEESVLLEQTFVIDGETKVAKAVEAVASEIGAEVKVTGFVRFVLGEGIEREESDFAAEVAATAKG